MLFVAYAGDEAVRDQLTLYDLRADRGVMDVVDADDHVIGEAPASATATLSSSKSTCSATPTMLCDPTRPSTHAHHARLTSPSNTAMSVWPSADPLCDWKVLT
ncbi:hypothetical protein OG905_10075 [Streptomyces sp. NBC_00322]|uniref:hypothetical protein n=1 Tax=Streptomyces sp. NBC_00322 TaxID=2975712 RepID=UPI002E2A0E56|nr:hypothetical protein [Streptomyces sp. NBC_00322]